MRNYRPGDRIFIFGFSRGAAVARMLANLTHEEGIPESITITEDDKSRVVKYKNRGDQVKVDVEMLGVWDTVAAFGIPVNLLGIPFQRINLFRNFTISPNIKKAYHLVSVNENRDAFTPTLMNHDPDRIEEVWFSGVHSDVGGGYDKHRLADIALRFMMVRAKKHGLKFHEDSLDETPPNPYGLGVVHWHGERPADYKMGPRKIGVSRGDKIDESIKPKIHRSVFERMEKKGEEYQPESILGLNGFYDRVEPDEDE